MVITNRDHMTISTYLRFDRVRVNYRIVKSPSNPTSKNIKNVKNHNAKAIPPDSSTELSNKSR